MLNLNKLIRITLTIQLNIDGSSQSDCLDVNVEIKQIDIDYTNDTIKIDGSSQSHRYYRIAVVRHNVRHLELKFLRQQLHQTIQLWKGK